MRTLKIKFDNFSWDFFIAVPFFSTQLVSIIKFHFIHEIIWRKKVIVRCTINLILLKNVSEDKRNSTRISNAESNCFDTILWSQLCKSSRNERNFRLKIYRTIYKLPWREMKKSDASSTWESSFRSIVCEMRRRDTIEKPEVYKRKIIPYLNWNHFER